MAAIRNLLFVEDDEEWRDIYGRIAARSGLFRVKFAENLRSAKSLIDEMQFAVVLIDVGLDIGDDQNVDGMRVMEKIRSIDDPSSIVVVTGRSGRDVMPIARNALKRFNAIDIVQKSVVDPIAIKNLLQSGLEEYEKQLEARSPGRALVPGGMEKLFWEDEMLRVTGAKGGAPHFNCFIDRLIADFIPLVPVERGAVLHGDTATGLVHGAYWSRAIGDAIAVCFGTEAKLAAPVAEAKHCQKLLDKYPVDDVLTEQTLRGLSGAVFSLCGASRNQFAASAPS